MGLEFKTKPNRKPIELITNEIFDFIINNPIYLKISFAILSTFTNVDLNIRQKIYAHPMIDDVEDEDSIDEYVELVEKFYIENIAYRRGDLLELLSGEVTPLHKCEDYNIIPESLVYENGKKLGEKDIDIITEYNDVRKIECIECKANIKNFIGNPMDDECKSKLDFMQHVSDRAYSNKIECSLLFATYREDTEYTLSILKDNNYTSFAILNSYELINRLGIVQCSRK